jgi:hypothetical protein
LRSQVQSRDGLEVADESFVSSWDLEDRDYIGIRYFHNTNKIIQMIKAEPQGSERRKQLKALKDELVKELRERLRRRYNDQTVYDFKMKNRYFEPQKIGYKYDRVTNDGIQRIFENATGENGTLFTHFAAGDGNSDTFPNTKGLDHEIVRVKMVEADTGFFTASGTTLNAGGFISESIQTFAVKEVGAVDGDGSALDDAAAPPDTFLFRSVFPSTDIVTHNFGTNFIVAVHAIYAKSV